eukprot:s558_g2.t1
MPPCERCGTGTRKGRGRGWCTNEDCRKEENEETERSEQTRKETRRAKGAGERGPYPDAGFRARKQARKEEREQKGAAERGPCPGAGAGGRPEDGAAQARKQAREQEREEKGAGERGPCPGEGGRPEDVAAQARKQAREQEREEKGAGERGPCPGEGGRPEDAAAQARKQARKEEREAKGAGERGPCPGEGAGGRPDESNLQRGPPLHKDGDFEKVKDDYIKFLIKWSRFGLSKACEECGVLTPGRHCCLSRATGKLTCKNCREKTTPYILPTLPPIPAPLADLNSLERRLLAKAKVNQVLIDKLPAGGPSAQWGRMYVVPVDEPCLCNVLDGAELRGHGEVYVNGVQGMLASTARVEHLQAALHALQAQHVAYKDCPAVAKALADMAAILEQTPAALQQELADKEEGAEEEELEVTYLMPRDPAIPKADRADLQDLRRKAKAIFPNVDPMLFPHLFPEGLGGYQPDVHDCFSQYARKRLLGQDGRFENDPAYIMWLLEEQMKKRLSGNVNVRMKNQLTPQLGNRFDDFTRHIFTALRDLPGTQPYLFAKRGVAVGMYEQLGKPQFFLTLTCHAKQPGILAAAVSAKLIRLQGSADQEEVARILYDYQKDEDYKWNDMTATQLCNSMPAIVARQFMHGLRQLLHWLGAADFTAGGTDEQDRPGEDEGWDAAPAMGQGGKCHCMKADKPPFKVFDYIVRIEWQKRGYPHAHILLWTDVPDVTGKRRPEKDFAEEEDEQEAEEEEIDWSDEEARARVIPTCAEELSNKYISTKSANRWMKDPRIEPEYRAAMAKLATLTEHSCGPYCGRYTLGSCRFGFPRAPEKQTRWRTPQEQFSSRWKSSLAARRHEDDGFVGQYNEAILRFWRASMDLQVVCELNCASKYILGYCFKSEEDLMAKKRVDNILQSYMQDAGRVDLTNNEVYKAAHAATQGRTTSTFEAVHYLLGYAAVLFSRGNAWLQVGPPSTWTLSVPQAEEEEALQDPAAYKDRRQEAGGCMPAAQRWYQQLQLHFPDAEVMVPVEGKAPVPKPWCEVTFFDFAAGFRFGDKAFNPDKVAPRKRPAIVGHRRYSPDLQPEEFYYSKLLLYFRWVEPGGWLTEADGGSHAAAFHRIATDRDQHPTFLQSICFPKLDGTVQAARELQAVQAVMFLKAKLDNATWTHTRVEEDNYQDAMKIIQALKERHGDDIDFMARSTIPTGPATDIFAPVEGGEAGGG